jgi:hypothetical protein
MNTTDDDARNENLDPLTGEPGAHPVATGVGSAAVGAAGLIAAAAVAGPVGIAAAAVGGAVIGGYMGKAAGELIDPTAEEAFWRENHSQQPFAQRPYEEFMEAYRTGYMGAAAEAPHPIEFEVLEPAMRAQYESSGAKLPWETAREASRAAWLRAQERAAAGKRRGSDEEVS